MDKASKTNLAQTKLGMNTDHLEAISKLDFTPQNLTNAPLCTGSVSAPKGSISRIVRLRNERGLHARASAKFATLAQSFTSRIIVASINEVCLESVEGDAIMDLLLLGSACGEDIQISALGDDAKQALDALCELVQNRFGEDK